jgi:Undecaprenyl-phosphate glucose phosphotransferase
MSDAPAERSVTDVSNHPSLRLWDRQGPAALQFGPLHVEFLLALCDVAVIALLTFMAALAYHVSVVEEGFFRWPLYATCSVALGVTFSVFAAMREHYDMRRIVAVDTSALSAFKLFNIIFAIFVCVLFMSRVTDIYSRASLALQYFVTCGGLALSRVILGHVLAAAVRRGRIEARRIVLIGSSDAIAAFAASRSDRDRDATILTTVELPEWASEPLSKGQEIELDLMSSQITTKLRSTSLDDIVILLPWRAAQSVEILAKRLTALPATIQLLPNSALSWFRAPAVTQISSRAALSLSRPPLTIFDRAAKRAVDITLATLILVAVAPLMLIIAVAIWAESGGPVLFRQLRHGFNERPFRILKFRTMTTCDDGAVVVQAKRGDSRVTAVGRILRQSSLDELPQLINVLKGDMSLVGPRPHALAHTREYEEKIAFYAHRHNVKPGLTGWAQVNGFRGETDAPWKMEKRVEHDLYYIDNWSLMLDFKILAMTVLSENTFKNAC